MTPETPDLAEVEERLERLERELRAVRRRSRWLVVVAGLGVVGVVLAWTLANTTATAQAQAPNIGPKVIRANMFILDDENGKARAMLTMFKDGPGLDMSDEKGKIRAMLSTTKDGATLDLLDANGKMRVGLRTTKDGAALDLFDAKGKAIWSQP